MTTSDGTLSSCGESTSLQGKRPRREIMKHAPGLHALVFGMHGLLVAMHLGLLIIGQYGLEGRVRVPVGRPTTVLSLVINISSQTFAIVYLAALLYLTQRIALRRILRSGTRTLTSIHDRQVAWSGLGSAVNAWWNQLSIPASIWGVGNITVYLTLTAGLKVTTPALFRLVPANQSISFAANSTLSSPFLHSSLWKGIEAGYVSDPQLISSATFLASILMDKGDRPNDEFGLGLQNNMLYDIVAADTGPGTTTVNTHTMNVTCGTSTTANSTSQRIKVDGRLYWDISRPKSDYTDGIAETAPNVLHVVPPDILINDDGDRVQDLETVWVYGSFNVRDASGKVASQVFLHPPMNPLLSAGAQIKDSFGGDLKLDIKDISKFNVSSLSYFRCSLAITNNSLPLDTGSGSLIKLGAPRKTTSSWPILDNENMTFTGGPESLWAYSLSFSEITTNLSCSSFCGSPDGYGIDIESRIAAETPPCAYLTQAERALMDKLSIHPPARDYGWWWDLIVSSPSQPKKHEDIPVANVMLHDFKNALEDYAAAFYWSYALTRDAVAYLRHSPTTHEIEVTGSELVSQLQLDTLPVVAGTIVSIALLILSPILVGLRPVAAKRKENIDFDTLGVLETVWLAGAGSAVTAVEIPSTKHLRKAGMSVETSGCKWRGEAHPLRRRSSSIS
ncbi:hypothetical protein C8J57DRAFT_1593434 [Mycena rebaudengoi]|nr:hypothetical protein C8J57DRAFT_1593434 [Mycena rebaudengoi]